MLDLNKNGIHFLKTSVAVTEKKINGIFYYYSIWYTNKIL
jgi:hypothetical protein